MTGIPGASLSGVNYDRIERIDPAAAAEIKRIGTLLSEGTDDEGNFVRLGKLLFEFGEVELAERLLLANAEGEGLLSEAFNSLFPHAKARFSEAISAFSRQFNVTLRPLREARLLSEVFRCEWLGRTEERDFLCGWQAGDADEVHITYEAPGAVVADLYSNEDNGGWACPMRYGTDSWVKDDQTCFGGLRDSAN